MIVEAHLDHIVVGVRNLDEGVAAFERMSGVAAVRGGQHPARGTENALVSLGAGRYLELMAPRKDAAPSPDVERLRLLARLTIVGWAVAVRDMEAARRTAASAGVTFGNDVPGSRLTPAGTTLQWTTADLVAPRIAGAPFFIHWKLTTGHPSTTSPAGCSLAALEISDPAAADLSGALNALRVSGVTVRRGEPLTAAAITCANGRLTLTSSSARTSG